MLKKKETVAMLLAGGQGSRLYTLTEGIAKPAVLFGGKYRIIDFPLSNCINSGIDTVGVLTQYQLSLTNISETGSLGISTGQTAELRCCLRIRQTRKPIGIRARRMRFIRIFISYQGMIPIMLSFFREIIYTKWTMIKCLISTK